MDRYSFERSLAATRLQVSLGEDHLAHLQAHIEDLHSTGANTMVALASLRLYEKAHRERVAALARLQRRQSANA